jgi:hypothetical protein
VGAYRLAEATMVDRVTAADGITDRIGTIGKPLVGSTCKKAPINDCGLFHLITVVDFT